MLRLQNEVIVVVGKQERNELFSLALQTMVEKLAQVRPPFTRIIVNVNGRHAARFEFFLQRGDTTGDGQCSSEQAPSPLEFEVVQTIDQNERNARFLMFFSSV